MRFTSLNRFFETQLLSFFFWVTLIFYCVHYTAFGLEDGDGGAIFGISWSMYNGLFPYIDFTYIKPPFSPFFHSLIFYITIDYAYLISRGFYFVQVFLYSLWAIQILAYSFKINHKQTVYFFALIGALVSVHTYPPMPWNTIDGLFFATLSLRLLITSKPAAWKIATGTLCLFLAVLCKQSFFFIPVFLAVYLLFQKKYKLLIQLILYSLIFLTLFVYILYSQQALNAFWTQLFSFTGSGSFFQTGFLAYFWAFKTHLLGLCAAFAVGFLLKKYTNKHTVFYLSCLGLALIFLYVFIYYQRYYEGVKYGIIHLLFLGNIIFFLIGGWRHKTHHTLLLLVSLSWCAGISNGFNTPIDFSAPLLFGLGLVCFSPSIPKVKWPYALALSFCFILVFKYGYNFVYQDSNRDKLTYNMGEVFDPLKGIKSDEETFKKYTELKRLSKTYPNFTVLPSMTLAHFVTQTTNPIGVDWVFNHHLANQITPYVEKLEQKNVTVLLENFEAHENDYENTAHLAVYVKMHWVCIDTLTHFKVYQKPQKKQ